MPSQPLGDLPSRFDQHTAVTRVGEDRFAARIHRDWWILAGPNGGYVAAIVLRALQEALDDPGRAPRSLTLHYLEPPDEGAVEIDVSVERSGRSLTTLSAAMTQAGRPLVRAISSFSLPRTGATFRHLDMPEVEPPEAGVHEPGTLPMGQRYDYRWLGGGRPSGSGDRARIASWLRFAEPRRVDALSLAAYCDALPPAVFVVTPPEQTRGVPTVELTIHFLASLPLPDSREGDYVLLTAETPQLVEGFLEEDVALWSRDGALLARSRQLAICGARNGPGSL